MMWVYPVVGYFIWQAWYAWVTEVRDKKRLDDDASLQSSVRYMARRGHKNFIGLIVLNVCTPLLTRFIPTFLPMCPFT